MKIQLKITANFISFEDNDEERVMHSKSDNKKIKINEKSDKFVKKLFKSLLNRYQNNLETSKGGSDFIFDYIHLDLYKCHKVNPNHGESYIDSSNWIKNKKTTINSINKKHNE